MTKPATSSQPGQPAQQPRDGQTQASEQAAAAAGASTTVPPQAASEAPAFMCKDISFLEKATEVQQTPTKVTSASVHEQLRAGADQH